MLLEIVKGDGQDRRRQVGRLLYLAALITGEHLLPIWEVWQEDFC
jgi:hypothetical protein